MRTSCLCSPCQFFVFKYVKSNFHIFCSLLIFTRHVPCRSFLSSRCPLFSKYVKIILLISCSLFIFTCMWWQNAFVSYNAFPTVPPFILKIPENDDNGSQTVVFTTSTIIRRRYRLPKAEQHLFGLTTHTKTFFNAHLCSQCPLVNFLVALYCTTAAPFRHQTRPTEWMCSIAG